MKKQVKPTVSKILFSKWLLCLAFLTLYNFSNIMASHNLGAEIIYECTGNPGEYRIILKYYRDCDGVSAPTSPSISYSSLSCGESGSLTLTSTSVTDISIVCPTETSSCSGGLVEGVEEYIFEALIVLPEMCTDWVFSFSECCRNSVISNAVSGGIYVSALLDNTLSSCNNSPQFNNPASIYGCAGQPLFYNHGATDIDGDLLLYSLVDCMESATQPTTYNAGFSGSNPISTTGAPFSIDPFTGALEFTPDVPQVAIVCVKVEEFRDGMKIGEIVRDIQFNIQDCAAGNTLPTVSGPFDYTATAGVPFCFDITPSDADGDGIIISSNESIVGTFTPSLPTTSSTTATTQFCWTPTAADQGTTQSFTIVVTDDHCPESGSNIFSYEVEVLCSNIGTDLDMDGWDDTCDCDDNDPTINPGVAEICNNGRDDNCDGIIDWIPNDTDMDGDSFGTCADCDDTNPTIYLGAPELCDGLDNNCDGITDPTEIDDIDMDGFTVCEGDCDDNNPNINPGMAEICGNGIDDNCDGINLDLIEAGEDVMITSGEDVTLSGEFINTELVSNYLLSESNSVCSVTNQGTPIVVPLSDDQVSAALPIGFTFPFYGLNYTEFYISSNGFVSFTGDTNGCCSGTPIPSTNTPNAYISMTWEDLNPSGGNSISYYTANLGTANCMVIDFNNTPFFGGGGMTTGQIIICDNGEISISCVDCYFEGNTSFASIENEDGTLGAFPSNTIDGIFDITTFGSTLQDYCVTYSLGCQFVGWVTDPNDIAGTLVSSNLTGDIVNPTQTTTYYAIADCGGGLVCSDSFTVTIPAGPCDSDNGTLINQN